MFELQVSMPVESAYADLGVDPESFPEEIREAKNEAVQRITKELAEVQRELEAIRNNVPGLAEVQAKARGGESDAGGSRGADIRRQLAELEARACQFNPNFPHLKRRIDELEQRRVMINGINLDSPEQRRRYDLAHPPLSLLKLSDTSDDSFVEPQSALHLVRREVASFLTAHGEQVFHPSDLTRIDFSSDFTPNSLLDNA